MRQPILCLFLLLSALVFAQQNGTATATSQDRDSAKPKLPVIDENACPFEGCAFREWTVTKDSTLYSTWQDSRTETGKLKRGDKVTGITGVHVTRKPDRILVRQSIPDLAAKPGDVILRYMYVGEGFANIWVSGHWHKEYDCSFVTERNGSGCSKGCAAVVTEDGVKEWWVHVKVSNGETGWVLTEDNFDGMDMMGTAFSVSRARNQLALHGPPYRLPLRLAKRAPSNSSPFCQPTSLACAAASQPSTNPKRAIAASPVKSILG
jgi:hypothetical protein